MVVGREDPDVGFPGAKVQHDPNFVGWLGSANIPFGMYMTEN
jgi:hypothetical protein